MDKECCENCRYSRPGGHNFECHRRAPAPYNALAFHFGDLIREIGWILHIQVMDKAPEEDSDLQKETTEAGDYAVWPKVEADEWCGEWREEVANHDNHQH